MCIRDAKEQEGVVFDADKAKEDRGVIRSV